jgi:hypothetical protein
VEHCGDEPSSVAVAVIGVWQGEESIKGSATQGLSAMPPHHHVSQAGRLNLDPPMSVVFGAGRDARMSF